MPASLRTGKCAVQPNREYVLAGCAAERRTIRVRRGVQYCAAACARSGFRLSTCSMPQSPILCLSRQCQQTLDVHAGDADRWGHLLGDHAGKRRAPVDEAVGVQVSGSSQQLGSLDDCFDAV